MGERTDGEDQKSELAASMPSCANFHPFSFSGGSLPHCQSLSSCHPLEQERGRGRGRGGRRRGRRRGRGRGGGEGEGEEGERWERWVAGQEKRRKTTFFTVLLFSLFCFHRFTVSFSEKPFTAYSLTVCLHVHVCRFPPESTTLGRQEKRVKQVLTVAIDDKGDEDLYSHLADIVNFIGKKGQVVRALQESVG